jgi:hypothetical protein
VIPNVDRNYGRLVIFVDDDGKAIVQGELLAGDFKV